MSSSLFDNWGSSYESYPNTDYVEGDKKFGELKKGDILYALSEDLAERIAWLEKQGKRDARYKCLEELLEADTEYQIAMNDAMVEEAKTKAIEAISDMPIL